VAWREAQRRLADWRMSIPQIAGYALLIFPVMMSNIGTGRAIGLPVPCGTWHATVTPAHVDEGREAN
jgi:hypothetical protein